MHSEEIIQKVRDLYKIHNSLRKVAKILQMSYPSVRYMVKNDYTRPKKGGRPKIVKKREETRIKKEIRNLNNRNEVVTARKVLNNLQINVNVRTIQRTISNLGFRYKKIPKEIHLSKKHKICRLKFAEDMIRKQVDWKTVIFSDEKRFNLDGPDNIYSYMDENSSMVRQKRQMGGGGLMVWGMVFPDGQLELKLMIGKQKSTDYIDLLENFAKPKILNYFKDKPFIFQQDNCSIHVSKLSKSWTESNFDNVLDWPSKSPDLNPIENVWRLMSRIVYEHGQFETINSLWECIHKTVNNLNANKSEVLKLIDNVPSRLIEVVKRKGGLTNY